MQVAVGPRVHDSINLQPLKLLKTRKYHHWHWGLMKLLGIMWFAIILLLPIKLFLLMLVLYPVDGVFILNHKNPAGSIQNVCQELLLSSQLGPHSALLVMTGTTTEDSGASGRPRRACTGGASGRAPQCSHHCLVLLGFLQVAGPRGLVNIHDQFQI